MDRIRAVNLEVILEEGGAGDSMDEGTNAAGLVNQGMISTGMDSRVGLIGFIFHSVKNKTGPCEIG